MHDTSHHHLTHRFARRVGTDPDAFPPDLSPGEPSRTSHGGRGEDDDAPLRGRILPLEHLQRHARAIAATHRVRRHRTSGSLLARLAENERVLADTHALVAEAASRGRRVTPASEWLLDNFYLVEEQIRSTRRLLPRGYLDQLPAITADRPRTYALALEIVTNTDGRVDAANTDCFVAAYQSVASLSIGELWAMPLMLRLALIENLRRIAQGLGKARRHRDLAADWAGKLLDAADRGPADLVLSLADMTRAFPPLSGAFLAEFTRLLQGHARAFALASTWLDHCLVGRSMSLEQMVLAEGRRQAADQVSVGHTIGSLRFLAVHDWREFVAAHSVVEQVLATDPAAEYPRMDFTTRNRYRTCIETIARNTRQPEEVVARRAVTLAKEAAADAAATPRESHVGYWLIDAGCPRLLASLGGRRAVRAACGPPSSLGAATALVAFMAATGLVTAVTLGIYLTAASAGVNVVVAVPLTFVCLHLAVGLVTWAVTLTVKPHPLPRLDYRAGIPADQRTLVAIPAMLTDAATVQRLLEDVELRFLGNRDPHLHFAILSDLADADAAVLPDDELLVSQAVAGIDALNRRHPSGGHDHFLLLHRSREWNERDGVWMGRERKRGKLAALNTMLHGRHGDGTGGFTRVAGDVSALSGIRHVITLDADSELPPDTARRLVGAMAHILNRPVVDAARSIVVAGHGILQPRMASRLPSARRSLFSRLMAGRPGIDPYTRVVSDLYQDLFDEGSFIGKGIYDVDAFEKCCGDFSDHTILSHDLLEGCHCRSGLESDVVLHEDHPASYLADARRRHRWIRGDWQILWWLLPRVPGRAGWIDNPLSAVSQWKILDNLRRSLVPPAMVIGLVAAWFTGSPRAMWAAALLVAAAALLPPLLAGLLDFLRKPHDAALAAHLREVGTVASQPLLQGLFWLVMLAHEAAIAIDAIVRTLFRMLVTRRRLLEWRTAADAENGVNGALSGFVRTMAGSPILAAAVAAALVVTGRAHALVPAGAWLTAWSLAPLVAWWVSRPLPSVSIRLSEDDRGFLTAAGRRTWRYFEEFVTERTHWLPPDNVQLDGAANIALRTSPTNVAMGLLSDLTACDFGWCSVGRLLDRMGRTFDTLDRLERHRGHLFNWYDIQTLAPLSPRYVSTVDSGNFVGSLIVLAGGVDELSDAPVPPTRLFAGLLDTVRLVEDSASPNHAGGAWGDTGNRWADIRGRLARTPPSVAAAAALLPALIETAHAARAGADEDTRWWIDSLLETASDQLAEVGHLAPWASLPPAPEHLWQRLAAEPARSGARLREALDSLLEKPSLRAIAALHESLLPLVAELERTAVAMPGDESAACLRWLGQVRTALEHGARNATARLESLRRLADASRSLADLDFRFLYDPARRLFAIGFNVTDHRLDAGYYDLLASEARLTSYVLVARRQLDQDHWFSLGRTLTMADGAATLLSWSGSMFEYLMPLLVMPSWRGTLLDHSCRAAVHNQIGYGRRRGVPWGISESGYNARDAQLNYQYRAFGVPGLGLKRGLAEDLVIAPYASALALLVEPEAACGNLRRIAAAGGLGRCGFIEAIDFTPSRRAAGSDGLRFISAAVSGDGAIVRQFMAHHQGMSLLAYAAVLLGAPMQRRFLADPALRSASLLLQERIPKLSVTVFPHPSEASHPRGLPAAGDGAIRRISEIDGPAAEMQLLSNGRYHVAISAAGGGWSRWQGLAVTRWRGDATRDSWGQFCYLRDLDDGHVWSNTWQPTTRGTSRGEAVFMQSRAEFRRVDREIEAHTLVSVSPDDDVELRRLSLTNRSSRHRTIEVVTYAEVVLAPQLQDESHPAFSNLFVETESLAGLPAILARRRPRHPDEQPPWLVHLLAGSAVDEAGGALGPASLETDREAFLGRCRSPRNPAALERPAAPGRLGATLDPVVSIRRTVALAPGATVRLDILTGAAASRGEAAGIAAKCRDTAISDRILELAWTRGAILLQQLGISERESQAFGRLAGPLIHGTGPWHGRPGIVAGNRRGQASLWGHGISGDLPIVLVRIRDRHALELVEQALRGHAWWRMHGLDTDLVLWNEDTSVYRQELHEVIIDLVAASPEASLLDRAGGVFVRRGEQLSDEDRLLLEAAARVVLTDEAGTLVEQAERRIRPDPMPPLRPRGRKEPAPPAAAPPKPAPPPVAFNGIGGFTADGAEYVIHLDPETATPAPWVNCLANPRIGTVVSETGGGCTWVDNSHEFRLTPWTNDPVSDAGGEAVYLRDEESGRFWSPCPYPARGPGTYTTRHGVGTSVFTHAHEGLRTELTVFVADREPVKLLLLSITNMSGRPRLLSVVGYWEWVLGELRSRSGVHVVTEVDALTGALLARSAFASDFGDMVAFVDSSEMPRTVTGDRAEFIGRNGSLAAPAALGRTRLSGRTGACLDPCGAMQVPLLVDDGESRSVSFTLGAASRLEEVQRLVAAFRGEQAVRQELTAVGAAWQRRCSVVQVECPDAAVNALVNHWLPHQVMSCRLWGRTAAYQSSGGYGFRDQLQDAMGVALPAPELLREHLLRAAGRQFEEGDVQHWWHPPAGRGVRTHCADDFLWLPAAVCRYVRTTADTGVLDEPVPFLQGRRPRADEASCYEQPHPGPAAAPLYEHCLRAVEHALTFLGGHGLPLFRGGDWNDGMDLVGRQGRGESVWLAFFLYDVLNQFAALAERRDDVVTADRLSIEAGRLRGNIEDQAWDGSWYTRGWFDDGLPLGSASSVECRIDSVAQSWAALSGAAPHARAVTALASVGRLLVSETDRLVQLLAPPFDAAPLEPGYIKGYPPGIRENGGQYTHAAVWAAMAFARVGDHARAWEVFRLVNPVSHGDTAEGIATYRVEPYVLAGDVCAAAPHAGRGGWTWYTGSAGWTYRLLVETLLGIEREGTSLTLAPHPPRDWPRYTVRYRHHGTTYTVHVHHPGCGTRDPGPIRVIRLDGVELAGATIPLVDDGVEHVVEIELA